MQGFGTAFGPKILARGANGHTTDKYQKCQCRVREPSSAFSDSDTLINFVSSDSEPCNERTCWLKYGHFRSLYDREEPRSTRLNFQLTCGSAKPPSAQLKSIGLIMRETRNHDALVQLLVQLKILPPQGISRKSSELTLSEPSHSEVTLFKPSHSEVTLFEPSQEKSRGHTEVVMKRALASLNSALKFEETVEKKLSELLFVLDDLEKRVRQQPEHNTLLRKIDSSIRKIVYAADMITLDLGISLAINAVTDLVPVHVPQGALNNVLGHLVGALDYQSSSQKKLMKIAVDVGVLKAHIVLGSDWDAEMKRKLEERAQQEMPWYQRLIKAAIDSLETWRTGEDGMVTRLLERARTFLPDERYYQDILLTNGYFSDASAVASNSLMNLVAMKGWIVRSRVELANAERILAAL